MRNKIIALLTLLSAAFFAQGQTDWSRFDKLMADGSYKSAYALAEGVYNKSAASGDRLAAAYHMAQAASLYQEDVRDSSVARYRALLPVLEPLEKALCYAFLGVYDSALANSDVLKQTPVERIKQYCEGGKERIMTPTAYDVIVLKAQNEEYDRWKRYDLQQLLVDFHAADGDDIRIWYEAGLLELRNGLPNRHFSVADFQQSINKFRGTKSPYYTWLYNLAAEYCEDKDDYVQAVRYCDTAIALAPKSEHGVHCANLRDQIKQKQVRFDGNGLMVIPDVPSLQRVRYRNVNRIWYRVVRYLEYVKSNELEARLLAEPVVVSGQWAVEGAVDYQYAESLVSLPALKAGRYMLLASPSKDFKTDGFVAFELHCTDMTLLVNRQEGWLLDRRTGRPIVGQPLRVERTENNEKKVMASAVTDSDGRYRFDIDNGRWSDYIVAERSGYTLKDNFQSEGRKHTPEMTLQTKVCTDRPIYKPGDTVHVAVLAYLSDGFEAEVAADYYKLQVQLLDPNGKEVDHVELTTDDFGTIHTSFLLPVDRIAGNYRLWVKHGERSMTSEPVRVEEYKQPKFMVELGIRNEELGIGAAQFGQPYTVHGLASSYNAVPISGAKVQYTVTRMEMGFYRRHWYNMDNEVEVATGETTTAADGSFDITFTPEPDSSRDFKAKPVYFFVVRAEVTDLNGESHEATTDLRIGFTNAMLGLVDYQTEVSELKDLNVLYEDLNDHPLEGTVQVKVERLRQPREALLDHILLSYNKAFYNTISEEQWRRDFPMLAYDAKYNDVAQWEVEKEVVGGRRSVAGGKCKVALPQLTSGTYRITLVADGADTVVEHITLTLPEEKKVQTNKLVWVEMKEETAEVGDKLHLRLGSRFKNVEVYYLLRAGDKEIDFRRLTLSDEIKSIDIAVDSAMLGGFHVELFTVYEGKTWTWTRSVNVPFTHKQLKVEIATFRDKLLPGETEEWTVRVRSAELGVRSSLVMTMYDDALNSYGGYGKWTLSPWRNHWTPSLVLYEPYGWDRDWLVSPKEHQYKGLYGSEWRLKDALPYYSPWRARMYKSARNVVVTTSFEVVEDEEEVAFNIVEKVPVIEIGSPESGARLSSDDIARMPGNSVESVVAAVGGIGYSDGGQQQEVQVRTNLNTLAFFAPNLRTGDDGTVTYRFTVPELLTRWNVKGLAITKDVKIGTLDKMLVTSKPLMVQPNMPRFLRSGDSLSLMAKVVLNEEIRIKNEELSVEVLFVLTDAATGDTICHHAEQVMVRDAAQVMFNVEVPQNVYVATYKIVASGQWSDASYSDGEQGQVAVVTNRQAVTVSQALYINGAGEKHFKMPEWLIQNGTREPHLVAAEVVSNPVWLAIKSMPYIKTYENPSTLYLANQLYINSKGQEVLKDLKDFIDFKDTLSRLKMNEDVKQTLLQATPWVQDAQSEEEQMAAVANYFDAERLNKELQKTSTELATRQNPDGGWSWMPEGKSSLWITQQVLKKIAGSREQGASGTTSYRLPADNALAFIDREQQRYYEKYIKPYLKKGYSWNPTDIDYLYTRSFYGKANTEAYKYYYANALKSYKHMESLYTQAQLALVFHRHGDHKEALDLLRRLKEKALLSDEMGMYWRDNTSGWFWYQRPIQTQALLIQAFAEITPEDRETIGLMQQWLLKQKQTSHWGNDVATTEAIEALMVNSSSPASQVSPVGLIVFGEPMTAAAQGHEGYRSQRWTDAGLDSLRANGSSDIVIRKSDEGIAWGAVYYQFTDDMDKIPCSDMGIKLKRSFCIAGSGEQVAGGGEQLSALKVGDKVKVRIDIQCDRTMEYLELIDGRPSCVEPLSTRAGWRWNEGLSYYVVVGNTDTRCYIDRLEKGKYWFEYEVYVTNPGRFLSGPVVMQCMYAPEFRATDKATLIEVAP